MKVEKDDKNDLNIFDLYNKTKTNDFKNKQTK